MKIFPGRKQNYKKYDVMRLKKYYAQMGIIIEDMHITIADLILVSICISSYEKDKSNIHKDAFLCNTTS